VVKQLLEKINKIGSIRYQIFKLNKPNLIFAVALPQTQLGELTVQQLYLRSLLQNRGKKEWKEKK